eukprot:Lithocolla_globosa_v1_NODE_2664_length_1915_cov_4.935484.p2 type:complete len:142 gc:universal NODE_2664_length_1915_cov_4.935484:465-40(-)
MGLGPWTFVRSSNDFSFRNIVYNSIFFCFFGDSSSVSEKTIISLKSPMILSHFGLDTVFDFYYSNFGYIRARRFNFPCSLFYKFTSFFNLKLKCKRRGRGFLFFVCKITSRHFEIVQHIKNGPQSALCQKLSQCEFIKVVM